jgi:hypothetical protein
MVRVETEDIEGDDYESVKEWWMQKYVGEIGRFARERAGGDALERF